VALRRTVQITILTIFISCLWASSDLHHFVQQITTASLRDHYYRDSDPLWDPLKLHHGKNREEGTSGHDSVKTYLKDQLIAYLGEDHVYVHEFAWSGGTGGKGYNIIGIKPGRNGDSSDVWIIGAHYDSYDKNATSAAPGANDNGSGMTGLLEMIRVINTRESDATIIFAFWDAEEPKYSTHSWVSDSSFGSAVYSGPSGSRAWINEYFVHASDAIGDRSILWERVKGYLNLDMFGYPGTDNTIWLYHGGAEWNDQVNDQSIYYPTNEQVDDLYQSAQLYLSTYGYDDNEPENRLTVIGMGTMLYSDNASFSRAGISSLEYAESNWSADPYYHQWSDYYRPEIGDETYSDENPEINFMTMVVRGALALLADTAGVDLISESATPVELISFKALSENNLINLTWSTASETENLGFLIEKRKFGDYSWERIANYLTDCNLIGCGNSSCLTTYSFSDSSVLSGNQYEYRLSDIDLNGHIRILNTTSAVFSGLMTESESQLYPNPFNPSVKIHYTVSKQADINIKVFDIYGREVENLTNNLIRSAGTYDLTWKTENRSSGIYLVQLCFKYIDGTRSTNVLKAILKK
jgi:hypothetical protein